MYSNSMDFNKLYFFYVKNWSSMILNTLNTYDNILIFTLNLMLIFLYSFYR